MTLLNELEKINRTQRIGELVNIEFLYYDASGIDVS